MNLHNQKPTVTSWLWLGLCGLVLFAVSACNADRPPAAGHSDPILGREYPKIAVLNDLEDTLLFGPPILDRTVNRPVRVEVPVRAATDSELLVQYRFEFFDTAGRPINPVMGWRFLRLAGRAQQFMQGAAMDDRAADWRLQVRAAQ